MDLDLLEISYPRRRINVACEVCRFRKTRCDGKRPSCDFCNQVGATCVYRKQNEVDSSHVPVKKRPRRGEKSHAESSDPPSLDVAKEIKQLWEVVTSLKNQITHSNGLEGLSPVSSVSMDGSFSSTATTGLSNSNPPPDGDEPYFDLESAKFPWMTTKSPSFVKMAYPNVRSIESQLRQTEIPLPLKPPMPYSTISNLLDHSTASSLLENYFHLVHRWYPLFDHETYLQYLELMVCGCEEEIGNPRHCNALLVAAISALVTQKLSDGAELYSTCCSFLPRILTDESLDATHSIMLFGFYMLFASRPFEANSYFILAFTKFNQIARRHKLIQDFLSPELIRTYWILYLVAKELLIHVTAEESKFFTLEDDIPLPETFETLNGEGYPQCHLEEDMCALCSYHDGWRIADAYLLSEITMRRFLQRATFLGIFSVKSIPNENTTGQLRFAPIISKELLQQLSQWRRYLPENLLGGEQLNSSSPSTSATRQFLELQYYACLVTIYWPAAYSIIESRSGDAHIEDGERQILDASVTGAAASMFDVLGVFMNHSEPLLTKWAEYESETKEFCFPYGWTVSITVFVFATGAVIALESGICSTIGTDSRLVLETIQQAVRMLRRVAHKSPSLAFCHELLDSKLASV